jgi:allantoin racemase
MRILLANSNTSPEVTAAMLGEARRAASPGTEIVGINATFGARIIGSRVENAVAAHALVDMLAEQAGNADAVLIGMSFDTGLWAAREMLEVPVLGMTEAALLVACTLAPRLGLIVLGPRSAQIYREVVADYGLTSRLAGIEALSATPRDLLADAEGVERAVLESVERLRTMAGVEVVVLAGAVMAGMPGRLQGRAPVPLVDGISSGVALAEALVRLQEVSPRPAGRGSTGARESVGLRPALAALLGAGGRLLRDRDGLPAPAPRV